MFGANPYNPYGYPIPSPVYGPQMGYPSPSMPQPAPGVNMPQNAPQNGMEVVPVPTIQQVEQVGLQPGQRKLIMVQNEPIVASRSADNMGLITTEYYRLEKFVPGAVAVPQAADYITRQEFNAFVESLRASAQKEAAAE